MKVYFRYRRLKKADWKARMPSKKVARKSCFNLMGNEMSPFGGVTEAVTKIGEAELIATVVCSSQDRFVRAVGRELAFAKLNAALAGM